MENSKNELIGQVAALQAEIKELKEEHAKIQANEHEHHECQVRFSTVFELSRLGNKIISSDLKILEVNPAMVALLGYDNKEEIIGTRILDYAPLPYN
ncbi:PAS domain-containing protein [Mucilaginibacter panaciglaebae]|uniref:PAS domain-containing protein n=1 Tax=Mucilaginibacter panaciglaebae TaxID=502331 RepID=A0ABP7WWP4_9SPHI